FFGRYFFSNYRHDPGFDSNSNPNLLYASGNGLGIKSRVNTVASGWDHVISSRLLNSARVSLAKTTALRVQGNGLPTFAMLGVKTYQYTNADGRISSTARRAAGAATHSRARSTRRRRRCQR